MKTTDLPSFDTIFREGQARPLKSVYPYVTAPAWTSTFSGVNPGKHGIFDMAEWQGSTLRTPNMRNSSVPFLWDYLTWAGRSVLVMGVPFVYPAPKVNGIFVSGRFTPYLSSYPEDLRNRFDLSGYEYKPSTARKRWNLIEKLGREAFVSEELSRLAKRVEVSLQLTDSRDWDGVILVDELPDKLFHFVFDDQALVNRVLSALDSWTGQLMKRMRKGDLLLVSSDHGFSRIRGRVFLADWLRSKHYDVSRKSGGARRSHPEGHPTARRPFSGKLALVREGFVGPGKRKRIPATIRDLTLSVARRAARTAGRSGGRRGTVVFTGPGRLGGRTTWVDYRAPQENPRSLSVVSLIEDMQILRRARLLENVFLSREIYTGEYAGGAPGQILIESSEGLGIEPNPNQSGSFTGPPKGFQMGLHANHGLLLSYGRDLQEGKTSPVLYDLVPTILDYLGLPMPNHLDGRSVLFAARER
jgi:predicted AlkP superfamily phosphohydrolase/phosphomutase